MSSKGATSAARILNRKYYHGKYQYPGTEKINQKEDLIDEKTLEKREFQLINEWFRHNEENIENFFDAIERAIPKWFEINLLIQHKEKEQDYKEKNIKRR